MSPRPPPGQSIRHRVRRQRVVAQLRAAGELDVAARVARDLADAHTWLVEPGREFCLRCGVWRRLDGRNGVCRPRKELAP